LIQQRIKGLSVVWYFAKRSINESRGAVFKGG